MNHQTVDTPPVDVISSIEAIRERKTELLFEFLRQKFEMDRQLRLLTVSEELAALNRAHELALNEVFLQQAK
jgi:hypothetical protein